MNSQETKLKTSKPITSEIEVNLKLTLPGGQEALDDMLDGAKWKALVFDLKCTIEHCQNTAEHREQGAVFKFVFDHLCREMAAAGLTLVDAEVLK